MTTLPVNEYPTHLKPSFSKIICHSDGYFRLRFPQPWFDMYGADIPAVCNLQMPNGITSTVGITKIGQEAYLEDNWRNFCHSHTVEIGDTLFFSHHGGPHLKILRFKWNGCMPDSDIIGHAPGLTGIRRNYPSGGESDDSEPAEGLSGNRGSYPSDTESEYGDPDAFTCVLIASNFERGLILPTIWWKTHIEDKDSIEEFTFWVDDYPWTMFVTIEAENVWISSGWETFARANELSVGTVCRFDLLPWPAKTFHVTFSR
ncbi:putative B3 domain-containing protein Os03g0619850 isoform X2 [Salvia splendens]|uniref:putative B3 domain-containing protein Os03g0619850 isoform X2 n=1 Tax=Salvia splendens TaxID=180675 RepID=UPI001C278E8B|nr:putative B3 domain-containing protein Os03g0619850 isoform X2 [Salvia splendens]